MVIQVRLSTTFSCSFFTSGWETLIAREERSGFAKSSWDTSTIIYNWIVTYMSFLKHFYQVFAWLRSYDSTSWVRSSAYLQVWILKRDLNHANLPSKKSYLIMWCTCDLELATSVLIASRCLSIFYDSTRVMLLFVV